MALCIVAMAGTTLVGGCGYKGGLYMPAPENRAPAAAPASRAAPMPGTGAGGPGADSGSTSTPAAGTTTPRGRGSQSTTGSDSPFGPDDAPASDAQSPLR